MRLLPESLRVLADLDGGAPDLVEALTLRSTLIVELVPSCIVVCLRLQPSGLTVGLADPAVDLGSLAPRRAERATPGTGDLLSEDRWQRERAGDTEARCAASIALAFRVHERVTGQLSAYATEPDAFTEHANVLFALVGAPAQTGVMNHDLPMRALDEAREATTYLADFEAVECAVGFLMARDGLDVDDARRELVVGADRARLGVAAFARALVDR